MAWVMNSVDGLTFFTQIIIRTVAEMSEVESIYITLYLGNTYRITAILKVETDIIANISESPIWQLENF